MSNVSSHWRVSGTVRSIFWVETVLPSTFADAAHIVVSQSCEAEPVILEVELQRVFARRQRLRAFPADTFEVEQVPQKDGLALEQVETVTAKTPSIRVDHALGPALRDIDLGGDGIRGIQKT